MYKKLFTYILGTIFCLLFSFSSIRAEESIMLRKYDEYISLISNYSGTDATYLETLTIEDLLDFNVGGFRFKLDWDRQKNSLILLDSQGNATPFIEELELIMQFLDEHPDRILSLFLDFNVNVNELTSVINELGVQPYLAQYEPNGSWSSLKEMVETGKRLVFFSMQEHRNSPEWLHYIWDYAAEPYFTLSDSPSSSGDFLKGDPSNTLLVYNDYNILARSGTEDSFFFDSTQNPYLIQQAKDTWMSYGRIPNFIFLDKYEGWIMSIIFQLRDFKTVNGTVTYNTQTLNHVSWGGLSSITTGKYSFPVGPGESLTLIPQSPGYRFRPESVVIDEPNRSLEQHFIGSPFEVTENLEGHYSFENGVNDFSINSFNGTATGVEFVNDSIRGMVAWFDGNSHVLLPTADELKLRDHDFTVTCWLKIDNFKEGKRDYCILGTTTGRSYQQSIHLEIRNRKPYFGFYSNDLQGKTLIESGKWYHITWRYSKLNGEQAIYVNGNLDSRSIGHPSYKGRDDIYIGLAGYDSVSDMIGSLDDLTIWSRALGEEEIWSVSKDVADLVPRMNIFIRYPILSKVGVIFIILLMLFWLYWKLPLRNYRKRFLSSEKIRELEESEVDYPERNFIQLFGDFRVVDKNGVDISSQFTPKIKQLFLLILVSSQYRKKGISTKELSDILWPDLNYQNAKNSRGVTIRKLRLILQEMEEVEILFNIDCWTINFKRGVYCDYIECLKLLNSHKERQPDFYIDFYKLIRAGEAFKGESQDWLDDYKGNIGNSIVDTLMKFINNLEIERDHELILKLSDRVLITDPINDQALSFKIKSLVQQNNMNTARFAYSKFAALYQELYNEKLALSFEDFLNS